MNRPRLAVAALLAFIGVVWVGQGLGYIGGSFMTSDLRWALIGAVVVVVAVAVGRSAGRSRR